MNIPKTTNGFLEENELISVEHQGVILTAKFILRTRRDFMIEILSPYTGFTTGLHKPSFASPYSSFLEDDGMDKAKGSLIKLFNILKEFFMNLESIKEDFKVFKIEHDQLDAKILELKNEIKDLKVSMKQKEISPKDYQKSIRPLKKEMKSIGWQKYSSFESLLNGCMDVTVGYNLQKEFFTFLSDHTE